MVQGQQIGGTVTSTPALDKIDAATFAKQQIAPWMVDCKKFLDELRQEAIVRANGNDWSQPYFNHLYTHLDRLGELLSGAGGMPGEKAVPLDGTAFQQARGPTYGS